jgi:hypothetical protein
LEVRLQQQAMLAEFGRRALTIDDLDELLREAAVLAAQGLETDMAKVMELVPERDILVLRAGVGWKPGVVGHATAGTDIRSAAGYALRRGFHNSRATRPATRKMHAAWSSDWMMKPRRS